MKIPRLPSGRKIRLPRINWLKFFRSVAFKRASLFLAIIFILFSGFIAYQPAHFLRFGYFGVFVFNLFGPGVLLIPSLVAHMNIWLLAFMTAAGMAFNDSISWYVGSHGHLLFPKSPRLEKYERIIRQHGMIGLFFWALIPFPYDFIGVLAGYLGLSFLRFLIPTFFGRFIRLLFFSWLVLSLL